MSKFLSDFPLNDVADWAQIVGLAAAAAALLVAAVQLRSAARTAQAQLILAIDDSLLPYEDVRRKINDANIPEDKVRLYRYIARFERIGILLSTKQLSLDTVNQLYGGRIEKLLQYNDAVDILRKNPNGWRPMIYLWQELHKNRHKYDRCLIPEPPQPTASRAPLTEAPEES